MKLLRQIIIRKDKYVGPFVLPIPKRWFEKVNLHRGDILNIYEEDFHTLKVVAEKNPFGRPEEVPQPGRKRK